jgi:hypothetical protein
MDTYVNEVIAEDQGGVGDVEYFQDKRPVFQLEYQVNAQEP